MGTTAKHSLSAALDTPTLHTHTHTHTYKLTHTLTHTHTHTRTHTHTHTHTHTRTHTYTHTHTRTRCRCDGQSAPCQQHLTHTHAAHTHTPMHTCTHAHIHTHKVWVRWAQRSLSAGLNTWRTSAHQQQQHAHFATAIRTRRHKSAKTCAVVNWYAHTADQKRFKRNTLAVGTFLNCRQLATEWRAWKWVLLRRQRQKVGARRGAMKRVYWLLTKVCNRWREQTICRVVDRFQNRIRAAGKTVRTLRRHSFTCVT